MYGDVAEPDSLRAALAGVHAAYYLVHSLESDDFERRDAEAAAAFGAAAADAGLEQIIYLGGLAQRRRDLSAHLRSRREVEQLLAVGGVPVTVLRAAIVIGHGGISWEITRQLVDHLPAMVDPALGEHPDPADRAGRRDPLPGRACWSRPRRAVGSSRSAARTCSRYAEMMQRVARYSTTDRCRS